MQKENIETSVDTFAAQFAAVDAGKRLSVLAHVVDLLRQAPGTDGIAAVIALLPKISSYPWSNLSFSVCDAVLAPVLRERLLARGVPPAKVDHVIFTGLVVFLDAIESDAATEETLFQVIDAVSETAIPAAPVQTAGPPPPAIFSATTLRPVFSPPVLTPELAEEVGFSLCFFRASVADPTNGHVLGPEVRGFAFGAGLDRQLFVLESGEILSIPAGYPHVRFSNTREELQFVSCVLPALTVTAVEALHDAGVLSPRGYAAIREGKMGKFSVPCTHARFSADKLAELEDAFDKCYQSVSIGVVGATSPSGAVARFSTPAEKFTLRVVLQPATNGPYVLSQLVCDSVDKAVMRHDTPRLYAARGVYLFPLPARVISFTIL